MTAKERERAFLIGAPLAIIGALVFLPAVTFLIVFPQVTAGGLGCSCCPSARSPATRECSSR